MSDLPIKAPPHAPGLQVRNFDELERFAEVAYQSGMFKDIKGAAQAAVKIMRGLELGLGPMESLSAFHVVEGKPTMSAQLMGALAQRQGYRFRVLESTDQSCRLEWFAPDGMELGESCFTLKDAERAGLANRSNWKRYPRNMLRARAVAEGARLFAAGALLGVYTPDEADHRGVMASSAPTPPPAIPEVQPQRLPASTSSAASGPRPPARAQSDAPAPSQPSAPRPSAPRPSAPRPQAPRPPGPSMPPQDHGAAAPQASPPALPPGPPPAAAPPPTSAMSAALQANSHSDVIIKPKPRKIKKESELVEASEILVPDLKELNDNGKHPGRRWKQARHRLASAARKAAVEFDELKNLLKRLHRVESSVNLGAAELERVAKALEEPPSQEDQEFIRWSTDELLFCSGPDTDEWERRVRRLRLEASRPWRVILLERAIHVIIEGKEAA